MQRTGICALSARGSSWAVLWSPSFTANSLIFSTQQLWQLRHVGGNSPRFVFRKQLGPGFRQSVWHALIFTRGRG